MTDSWDGERAPHVLERHDNSWDRTATLSNDSFNISGAKARHIFREFFRNYRLGNIYHYREALVRNWNQGLYFIEVDLLHITEYDVILLNCLQTRPDEMLPFFELAAKDALQMSVREATAISGNQSNIPDFQVILKSDQLPQSLRNLTAEHVNTLIKVPGIVISCSRIRAKATLITIQCTNCFRVERISSKSAMQGAEIPSKCGGEGCQPGSFVVVADNCEYIDQQTLKLQESPEVVPTGEMPRNIMLTVDRYLVDRVAPGTRVSVMGISSLMQNATREKLKSTSVRTPYLRVVGIQVDTAGGGRSTSSFSPQEEEEMQQLARDPDIYGKLERSIAPQISGDYTKDIKKAIACLLMSGSRKVLADGVRLRGDVNVLLMGDPSTAKSQFLKFVERVAPVGVYTSGKGSSAAGLTASVVKDSRGEFFLEGGAMVLADGGVICIDEFDKMRETDRVAIHEAMEQQTISVAKAGITTVLNCRASVLAAANPIFGRYDDLKSVGENIDLMSTILSRFDCIFIVRDVRDAERDRGIARHVLNVHLSSAIVDATPEVDIEAHKLKRYVAYCRERCAPRLSDEAAAMLSSQYVHVRNQVRLALQDSPGESMVVPITIRQLEAMVRLAEALAKMRLSAEAGVSDVEEAIRLFKVSTLAASEANPALLGHGSATAEIQRAEEFLRRRCGVRMTVNSRKIIEESYVQGHSDDAIKRAISAMVMRGELQELNQRKLLKRLK
mmetsp:Transcript_12370/g.18763  ORF Transcript_12370/g.18763 Transcript_12370/m.18763 type:complete len:729 (-) Transcript_12370:32-2218(-)